MNEVRSTLETLIKAPRAAPSEAPLDSPVDAAALDTLFREAHTHVAWRDKPVSEALLQELYALARMPPTSANAQPMRVVFVKSAEAKARLKPALAEMNVEKTLSAPVTAIVAHDNFFYEKLPTLAGAKGELYRKRISELPQSDLENFATLNGSLQGGYLILAARALGLDCGPMGGFDRQKVDAEFFADGRWRSSFLVNLGYGDPTKVSPRNPRLSFEEACRIV